MNREWTSAFPALRGTAGIMPRFWGAVLGFAAVCGTSLAEPRVWTGAGSDAFWSTAGNWEGEVPVANDALVFDGAQGLVNTNNLAADFRMGDLTFKPGAGAFWLDGNAVSFLGDTSIRNLSPLPQTLALDVKRGAAAPVWNTDAGDLILEGAFDPGDRRLYKQGLGRLVLRGANTYTGLTEIWLGTVEVDLGAGGGINPASRLVFGWHLAGGDLNMPGGAFVLRGAPTGTSSLTLNQGPRLYTHSARSRIVVDPNGGDGTTLVMGNDWAVSNPARLHIDLSAPGVALQSSPALTDGIINWATVTDDEKTGFATVENGHLVRNTNLVDWTYTDTAVNFRTSGDRALSALQFIGTLTIQGGGQCTGSVGIRAGDFLMEEGVSDYAFNLTGVMGLNTAYTVFHQHSLDGDLIMNAPLAGFLVKTGPGRMRVTYAYGSLFRLWVDEGELVLNADLAGCAMVRIRPEGILRGSAWLGDGSLETLVFPNGQLIGTHLDADAFTLDGTVLFQPRSRLVLALGRTDYQPIHATGTVTIEDGDLELSLTEAPPAGTVFTLLTSDAPIVGAYTRINGQTLNPNGTFELTHGEQVRTLELRHETHAVVAEVLPSHTGSMLLVR